MEDKIKQELEHLYNLRKNLHFELVLNMIKEEYYGKIKYILMQLYDLQVKIDVLLSLEEEKPF